MRRSKAVRASIALLMAAGSLCAVSASAGTTYADKQTEDLVRGLAADARDGKIIEVQSVALSRAYASNEVVADNQYKDKYLLVSATVESVKKDAFGKIVVNLRAANQFLPTMASFDKSVAVVDGLKKGSKTVSMRQVDGAEAAASISRGSSIKLLCKGKGYLLGTVQLAVCDVLYR